MIISHKNRFIFFHCRKTAGTSVTCYLNRFLGPNDIQVGAWRDTVANGGAYNQRFYLDILRDRFGLSALAELLRAAKAGRRPAPDVIHRKIYRNILGPQPAHAPAYKVKEMTGLYFDRYFKFCFVRNPYDRAYSDYRWRTQYLGVSRKTLSFLEFLQRAADRNRPDPEHLVMPYPDNWPLYTIDNKIVADYVGRFENLHADLHSICDRIDLPFSMDTLPHGKKSAEFGASYRNAYGPEERRIVERLFRKEIEQFHYEF